ncbi:MAG: 4a-hydroxytetrahydrobiopterin dehydratase [Deltaproteobacteria bacterium]|nr:MAG: 4a-hydroxytetrahydrobiopterin dehydratase [Deltaproteobacteria bacterium]
MSQALTHEQVQSALAELSGWTHENDKLKKTFERQDFKDALSFIVRLGLHAECMDHHPELFNVYNRVVIELTTHDAGNKVTQKDVNLAKAIESIA